MERPEAAPRRVFFALWPPAGAAKQLHQAARTAHADCGGRPTHPTDLHITLAFLGAVSPARLADAEAVADALSLPGFAMELDRLGWWRHNRILWAGCGTENAALLGLADALGAGLRSAGFALDARPFAVHATLLRNARCPQSVSPLSPPVAWQATEFVLAESTPAAEGARYAVRRRWPLAMPLD